MPLVASHKKAAAFTTLWKIEIQQGIIVANDDWQGVRTGHAASLLRCSKR